MSYTAPAGDAITASWAGAAPYTAPAGDAITASWYIVIAAGSIVYRAVVGTDPPLALPLASVRCARRLGQSTWMVLAVPTWSAALEAQLLAAVGATLTVERGDGTTWSDFLAAVLTQIGAEVQAQAGTLTLTGRVQTPSYTQGTRTLSGVQSRERDAGRRRARCAVDALVRPNDLADDGVQTWTVDQVTYNMDPHTAYMDVVEVAA